MNRRALLRGALAGAMLAVAPVLGVPARPLSDAQRDRLLHGSWRGERYLWIEEPQGLDFRDAFTRTPLESRWKR